MQRPLFNVFYSQLNAQVFTLQMVPAGSLKPGAELFNDQGRRVTVKSVKTQPYQDVTYNLTVNNHHETFARSQ